MTRSQMIRKAASLPTGNPERRALLALLEKQGGNPLMDLQQAVLHAVQSKHPSSLAKRERDDLAKTIAPALKKWADNYGYRLASRPVAVAQDLLAAVKVRTVTEVDPRLLREAITKWELIYGRDDEPLRWG